MSCKDTKPPKLWKYYLRATLYPMIASGLAIAGWLFYSHRWGAFSGIPREQLGGNQLDLTLLLTSLGNGLVMAALATPILFNAYPKIRNNPLLSLLTWSPLPMAWLLYIVRYIDIDELEVLFLVLSVTLPYLIANPWTFALYRRALHAAADAPAVVAGTFGTHSTPSNTHL